VAYFFGVLLLAACGFILVLSYLNVSPKGFLYKVAKRFIEPPESLRSVVRDAPYRRGRTTPKRVHRPVLLNLETSERSGQACHPDVVHIPGGFGAKRWPYWMVCTPYPYWDSYFENPEIFVSCDGITWAIPEGLHNPVVPSPKNTGDHNSDPDILFHEDELWLFYRRTLRSKTPGKIPDENNIFLMKSVDGARWSTPVEVMSEKTGAQLLSPAVVHDGSHFVMWTIEIQGNDLKLMRRNSPDGLTWSAPTTGSVMGLEKGRRPWHIDVIQERDRLSAMLVSCTGLGGSGARIHYAHSEDHGLTWFAGGFLLDQIYEFEANIQYRASFRKIEEDPHVYELWYSAASLTNMFSIAYMRLVRSENMLLPCEMRPADIETLTSV
jgi:hypothetical protein